MGAGASKRWDALVFDFDGTLVDTEQAAAVAMADSFRSWGLELPENLKGKVVGRTWKSCFDEIFPLFNLPVSHEEAAQTVLARYRAGLTTHAVEIPGAVRAVKELAHHYRLLLVTGSLFEQVNPLLKKFGLENSFELLWTSENYVHSKPHPEPYLSALSRAGGIRASHSLCFEDSTPGIRSARAAGLPVVAIEAANHYGHDQSEAQWKIKNLKEVTVEWVQGLPSRH